MGSFFDLAVMTVSSAPGTTANIPLGSAAVIGGVTYVSFAVAGATNGTVLDYSILDPINSGSEIGFATYSSTNGTLLINRTPTVSTNGSSFINASSGVLVRASPRAESLPNLTTATNAFVGSIGAGSTITPLALYDLQLAGVSVAPANVPQHFRAVSSGSFVQFAGHTFANQGTLFRGYMAGGVSSAPANAAANTQIVNFSAVGYGGGAFNNPAARFSMRTLNAQSSIDNSGYMAFGVTPAGTTVVTDVVTIGTTGATLAVTGSVTVSASATVAGAFQGSSSVTVGTSLTVGGTAQIAGAATFNGTTQFNGTNTVSANLTQNGGTLTVTNGTVQTFAASTTPGSGDVAINSNVGSSGTIQNSPLTGMPGWFISTDTGPAGLSLHRAGAYAINFGLNPGNYMAAGGWSDGTGVLRFQLGAGGDLILPYGVGVGGTNPVQSGDVRALSTAKAWVRFSGNGGVSVSSSFQVSSVTRSSVGVYVVNFTTALADTAYMFQIGLSNADSAGTRNGCIAQTFTIATGSLTFQCVSNTANGNSFSVTQTDNSFINVAIFR